MAPSTSKTTTATLSTTSSPSAAPFPLQMTWQSHLCRRKCGPPLGLRNLGNTCYLNSVLQCLTYTPPLANFCLQFLHSTLCKRQVDNREDHNIDKNKNRNNNNKTDCAFCILEKRIARSLNLDGATVDSPVKIGNSLHLFSANFQGTRQEDAHEFLRYVIDACHNTCLKASSPCTKGGAATQGQGRTIVTDIFGGALLSQIKCLSCSCESNKMDAIMDLSLDLFHSKSLNDALRRFFHSEILDGDNKYKCGSCKKMSVAKKQMFVLQAPNVLVIQLKRFEGINGGKINKDIAFEEILSLSGFMSKGNLDPKPEYNLFGSIVHSGFSPDSGHYYAYVKDPSGCWYCCNDSYVSLSNMQEVLAEKVYILFYLRVNVGPKTIKKLHESNGKSHFQIRKSCGMPKLEEGALHSENTVATHLKNVKLAKSPQIKFSDLKGIQKNNPFSMQISGYLNSGSDTRNKGFRQHPISENSSAHSVDTLSKNAGVQYSQEKYSGFGCADGLSSSSCQLKKVTVHSTVIQDNEKSSQGVTGDPAKSDAGAHKILNAVSGVNVDCSLQNTVNECGSDSFNKKRKSNSENCPEVLSNCSFFDAVKGNSLHGSYGVFAEILSLEGLDNLSKWLSDRACAELRLCGWAAEVHNFMRDQKRKLYMKAAGSPLEGMDLQKLLVADAKKIFITRIPQDLKEDLIECFRKSVGRASRLPPIKK